MNTNQKSNLGGDYTSLFVPGNFDEAIKQATDYATARPQYADACFKQARLIYETATTGKGSNYLKPEERQRMETLLNQVGLVGQSVLSEQGTYSVETPQFQNATTRTEDGLLSRMADTVIGWRTRRNFRKAMDKGTKG